MKRPPKTYEKQYFFTQKHSAGFFTKGDTDEEKIKAIGIAKKKRKNKNKK